MKKICAVCDNEFESKRHNALVCSDECRKKKRINKGKKYYLKNRETIIDNVEARAIIKKNEIMKYKKEYRAKNKEKLNATSKEYYHENREKMIMTQKEFRNTENGISARNKVVIEQKNENSELAFYSKEKGIFMSRWSLQEDIILFEMLDKGIKYKEIAIALNRTRVSITKRIYNIKKSRQGELPT